MEIRNAIPTPMESMQEAKPILYAEKYEIQIEPLSIGYKVGVGCVTIAISTKEELLERLTAYINDPGAAQQKWHQTSTI